MVEKKIKYMINMSNVMVSGMLSQRKPSSHWATHVRSVLLL